jgi:hypothetical protein
MEDIPKGWPDLTVSGDAREDLGKVCLAEAVERADLQQQR